MSWLAPIWNVWHIVTPNCWTVTSKKENIEFFKNCKKVHTFPKKLAKKEEVIQQCQVSLALHFRSQCKVQTYWCLADVAFVIFWIQYIQMIWKSLHRPFLYILYIIPFDTFRSQQEIKAESYHLYLNRRAELQVCCLTFHSSWMKSISTSRVLQNWDTGTGSLNFGPGPTHVVHILASIVLWRGLEAQLLFQLQDVCLSAERKGDKSC